MTKTRGRNRPSPNDIPVQEFLDRLDSLADDRMFSEYHAEAMFDLSVSKLREDRAELARLMRDNPAEAERRKKTMVPWVRVGESSIRYRLGDMREFQRAQKFGGQSSSNAGAAMIDLTGVGYAVGRLAEGMLPFGIVAGQPVDFIDSADNDDVDGVEWMLPEQAAFIQEIGARLEPKK